MKKNISRNPLWPDWYNGKKIDEVQFGRAFLEQWPLKCVNGTLYTLDGPVEDESEIKQRILENIEDFLLLRPDIPCCSHHPMSFYPLRKPHLYFVLSVP